MLQNRSRLKYVFLAFLIILILLLIFFNLNLEHNFLRFLKPDMIVPPVKSKSGQDFLLTPPGSNHLIYQLPLKTTVNSIFKGRVIKIEDSVGIKNIQIKHEDKEMIASYMVAGDVLIKENEKVSAGQAIATINSADGPGVWAGGNFGLYIFLDGKMISAPEMIQ